jgi:transposase
MVQQLSSFLLRHGHRYHRPAWTLMHRRWMAGLRFEQAAHHIVLEDSIAAVEAATTRRDRLEAHIEAALADWSLAPMVRALQALRGMALVAAATLVAGFANPRQLMAYLGLVPSERSSGAVRHSRLSWRRHLKRRT